MVKLPGQPLAWTIILLTAWVGARLSTNGHYTSITLPLNAMAAVPPISKQYAPALELPPIAAHRQHYSDYTPLIQRAAPITFNKFASGSPPALVPWQDGSRPSGLSMPALVAGGSEPISTGRDTPPTTAYAPVGKAGTPDSKRRWGTNLYAFSFWRIGTDGNVALSPQGQYGGSQSGFILSTDPFGGQNHGLAMLFRGAFTPDGAERELALGLRWKPASNIPLSLTAERRFRLGGTDRFSFYTAGGFDTLPIAGKLTLNAYGQAGLATGKGGGAFFDAQAKLMHPLGEVGGVQLDAGAGAWAGGQRSARRLDIGPTIAARVDAGPVPIILQLDWRLPVAGDVQPKGGLALTLSTGF